MAKVIKLVLPHVQIVQCFTCPSIAIGTRFFVCKKCNVWSHGFQQRRFAPSCRACTCVLVPWMLLIISAIALSGWTRATTNTSIPLARAQLPAVTSWPRSYTLGAQHHPPAAQPSVPAGTRDGCQRPASSLQHIQLAPALDPQLKHSGLSVPLQETHRNHRQRAWTARSPQQTNACPIT
jgi:hypothetical protein